MKEHERSRPPLRDIIAAYNGREIFLPTKPMNDGKRNLPIKTRVCGKKIPTLAKAPNGVFGAGDRWNTPVDFAQPRTELLVDNAGQLFTIGTRRGLLAFDEMPDDLPLRSAPPFVYIGRSCHDSVIGHGAP